MKTILLILSILTASVSAQENWGQTEFIWGDGGGVCYLTEPCFDHQSGEIIITHEIDYEIGYRIMDLDMNLLLPDSLSIIGFNDVSPFISYDGNSLYFSSDRQGGYGGFDIWKSERIDEEWTTPVNLGSEINSDEDETSPTLPADQDEIYFHRGLYELDDCSVNGHIYFSGYDDGWETALPLPDPVNSDYSEYKPSVTPYGHKLYFISNRPNGIEIGNAAWVSYREQGSWQEPILLIGEVNEVINSSPDCAHYDVVSAVINALGETIVFNKLGICDFCPDGRIYLSYLATGTTDRAIPVPGNIALSAYPNPFNANCTINYTLTKPGNVNLAVYDLLGRHVRNLVDEFKQAGNHRVIFDSADLKSGIYFYTLRSGDSAHTKRIVLLK